uniref:Rho GTPase-activating protein 19-like n=1 Tax=Phallusia mammillata TaxID=59560 RepID=A0A6F9D775_9ASCI|nr:rho GTPase-activating protein 19-like [Phallusia mammillata]
MDCIAKTPLKEKEFYNPDHFVIKLKFEKWEDFSELIISHLTRMLDLPGAELDLIRGTGNSENALKDGNNKLNLKSWSLMKKKEAKGSGFGSVLTDEAMAQVQQLTDFLGKNLTKEGLFRKPGNSVRQNQLITALSTGVCIDFNRSKFQAHDVASVLKTFLGQLSEPLLLPSKHFNAHLQIANMTKMDAETKTSVVDKGKRIETLQLLLLLLPTNYRNILRAIMNLLYHTARNQAENKMTAANLSAMFTPHLIWPRNAKALDIQDRVEKLNEHIAFMIRHSQKIFTAPLYIRESAKVFYPKPTTDCMSPQVSSTLLVAPSSAVKRSASARLKFNDRAKEQTENAISDLYNKVHNMPNSAKKKKIVKKFDKHHEVIQYKSKTRKRNRTFSGILRKKNQSQTPAKTKGKDSYKSFPQPGDDDLSPVLPKPDLLSHCNSDSVSLNLDFHEKNPKAISHVSLPENVLRNCKADVQSPRLTVLSKQIRLLKQRRSASPATRSQKKDVPNAPQSNTKQIKVSTV